MLVSSDIGVLVAENVDMVDVSGFLRLVRQRTNPPPDSIFRIMCFQEPSLVFYLRLFPFSTLDRNTTECRVTR